MLGRRSERRAHCQRVVAGVLFAADVRATRAERGLELGAAATEANREERREREVDAGAARVAEARAVAFPATPHFRIPGDGCRDALGPRAIPGLGVVLDALAIDPGMAEGLRMERGHLRAALLERVRGAGPVPPC